MLASLRDGCRRSRLVKQGRRASDGGLEMKVHPTSSRVVLITGVVYALIGLVLGVGGAWLLALGGSAFYVIAGLGILVTGGLLVAGQRSALWVYAAVLIGTLIWAVSEVRFDWWPLAARGDVLYPLGLWLLTPWVTRHLGAGGSRPQRSTTLPLWAAVVVGAVVLVIGLVSDYHETNGTIATASESAAAAAATQPIDDWRDYGGTPFGQRYSPLRQITTANIQKLNVAWTFRTGDLPGPNDPVETTFEVTPIKVRNALYFCSQHQRLFALDAKTGKLLWSYDPKIKDNPTFQHLTCRGVAYHETAPGAVDTSGAPAPTDCPRTIFLPVNDGRMIAVNADTGKPCESFANHGALDLQAGMGIKTAGFYEPTSPPVVSDKIIVVGGAVTDNYSTEEPSGVIRGFDIQTGKLVWAWDSGSLDENALPSANHSYTNNSPNSWMTASYDPALGLVYLPMGVQTPDIWGGNRTPAAERYASGLVALDINTGKRVWSYQTVHHDLWDMDLPSQPTLIDLRTAKGIVPAIIQPAKTGNLFVLDRRTGEPIVPAPERPVPQGAAPGDHVSPTQPFSELTFRPEQNLTGADMWVRHDLRPVGVPHRISPVALRGHLYAAFAPRDTRLPRQSRHVRVGRHSRRSGAADRDRKSDRDPVCLQAAAPRTRQSAGAKRRASARERGRRAADVWNALRRRAASLPFSHRPAVQTATLGLHGRDRSQDHEDRLDAPKRNHPRQRAGADPHQDGRPKPRRSDHDGRGYRLPYLDRGLFHSRLRHRRWAATLGRPLAGRRPIDADDLRG